MTDVLRLQLPRLDPRCGRHVEHDPRSRAYPAQAAPLSAADVVHEHYGVVLNQGQLGSCTGNAGAQALMTAPLRRRPRTMTQRKAVALYNRATVIDGFDGVYPPDDTGSSGLAVCKAMVEAGYISSYQWAFGIDHAKAALGAGPVMCGTAWYETMFDPDHGQVHIGGQIAGGHEYLCLGYIEDGAQYVFLNSWGRGWGVEGPSDTGGCFWMSRETFGSLLEDQGDVVQPIA